MADFQCKIYLDFERIQIIKIFTKIKTIVQIFEKCIRFFYANKMYEKIRFFNSNYIFIFFIPFLKFKKSMNKRKHFKKVGKK